ncbi:unnamed protein product [Prorocentrum cordatum]|uniref:Uncharacterized protein n=1 Tax=Prorocentrum cordatum TaxID=2364126 RepID=A0ABN9T7P4_9DINO|nr:unnamed protein product [Polarella glacialis]
MASLMQMSFVLDPYTTSGLVSEALKHVPDWAPSALPVMPEVLQLLVVTCSMIFGWAVLPRALVWICPAPKTKGGAPAAAQGSLRRAAARDGLAEAAAEAAAAAACAPAPSRRDPSWQSALALLESHGVLGAEPGAWSGRPPSAKEYEGSAMAAPREIPCLASHSPTQEMEILEHYGVLGAAPGSWGKRVAQPRTRAPSTGISVEILTIVA